MTTESSNVTDKDAIYYDSDLASASWQPIYVALALTSLQCLFFLIVYEVFRRNPHVANIYDRRRLNYPSRTPPHLRRSIFEWWRLRISDKEYNQKSQQEYQLLLERQRACPDDDEQRCCCSSRGLDEDVLKRAEEICRTEVPYFQDLPSAAESTEAETAGLVAVVEDQMEEGASTLSARNLSNDQEWASREFEGALLDKDTDTDTEACSSKQPPSEETLTTLKATRSVSWENTTTKPPTVTDEEAEDNAPDLSTPTATTTTTSTSPGNTTSSMPPKLWTERPPSILRSKSARASSSDPGILNQQNTTTSIHVTKLPMRRSQSEHSQPCGALVPLTIGGGRSSSERSISISTHHRRVRFGSDDDTAAERRLRRQRSVAATIGSDEAERLARLRFQTRDVPQDWDARTISTISKFVKKRVLMLSDAADEEPPTTNTSQLEGSTTAGEQQKTFIARKVMRRPLNAEDEELLRCIGLDAFMTLRFLQFSFDVFFWPMLLAMAMLMPLYLTAQKGVVGFYSTTIIALENATAKYWLVVLFGYCHFGYILRRIWIEWELFLPLRYDFLEHGDFEEEKYKEQYRKTCIVEYVPPSHKHDKALHAFFDAMLPGQVRRAEVLLNTEYLRSLIKQRTKHIMDYEDVVAKKVYKQAVYLQQKEAYEESTNVPAKLIAPREPKEPRIIVIHRVPRTDMGNVFFQPQTPMVRDPRTYKAREWHHENIQRLNKEIDDEYLRIAQEQRRPIPKKRENWLRKRLGLKYLTGADNGQLHSSTAFVEFRALTAKQEAIQCNITGKSDLLQVSPVPETRDIIWTNAHVSRRMIITRRAWANLFLLGGLIGWSALVTLIRSHTRITDWFDWAILKNPSFAAFVDVYLPALVVEGLVRCIPFLIKGICIWIRFKSKSEIDNYLLLWYFGYRFLTFIFVIIGGSLVDSSHDLVKDPVGFLTRLSANAANEAPFFISYVLVTGGMQIFFRLSQLHNLAVFWFTQKIIREEAVSQRRLDKMYTSMKIFHLDEFIPLFIFIFMVGALYGSMAPIASVFVVVFFKCAYKVFKYMTLFIYGKNYEHGGFLFYTLNSLLFFVIYIIILIIVGYLALRGSTATAGVFLILFLLTLAVQLHVRKTFVIPSRVLSLAKARISDDKKDAYRNERDRRYAAYLRAKEQLEEVEQGRSRNGNSEVHRLLEMSGDFAESSNEIATTTQAHDSAHGSSDSERKRRADRRMQQRYVEENDSMSDFTDSDTSDSRTDFFIYRQPSLNRATWELEPRPYRRKFCGTSKRQEDFEVWR